VPNYCDSSATDWKFSYDKFLVHPQRPLGQKVAQQFLVISSDRLRQHAFLVMTDRDGQSEALRIEGACGARDIHHAKQFAISWIVNRNSSAGPSLHSRAKVLCAVDLNRF